MHGVGDRGRKNKIKVKFLDLIMHGSEEAGLQFSIYDKQEDFNFDVVKWIDRSSNVRILILKMS